MTDADLAMLARSAGLVFADGADVGGFAIEVTEALRHYALWHRADRANAGSGEVEEWARGLQRWAADGLTLLGGTLDDNLRTSGWPPHSMAMMQLIEGWPAFGGPPHLDYLLHMAAGHPGPPDETVNLPDVGDVVLRCAAAVELIQILATTLAEDAACRPLQTRPVEFARRDLIRNLSGVYGRLHGREPKFTRSVARATKRGDRDGIPVGPVLDWLRGVFELMSSRSSDPVIVALADWARRPHAIADLLRGISSKAPEKPPLD